MLRWNGSFCRLNLGLLQWHGSLPLKKSYPRVAHTKVRYVGMAPVFSKFYLSGRSEKVYYVGMVPFYVNFAHGLTATLEWVRSVPNLTLESLARGMLSWNGSTYLGLERLLSLLKFTPRAHKKFSRGHLNDAVELWLKRQTILSHLITLHNRHWLF